MEGRCFYIAYIEKFRNNFFVMRKREVLLVICLILETSNFENANSFNNTSVHVKLLIGSSFFK